MKAIVLGGAGVLGLALITYLRDQKEISEVLVTDIQEDRIKERVAWLNSLSDNKKFSAKAIDALDYNSLVAAIKGYDVVLNVAYTPKGGKHIATRAALEAGANYIDSSVGGEEEQLKLDDEFKKKGLLAILDMFFSPGLINMLAAYAIRRLDRTDSVDLRWSIVDMVPASEHSRQLYWGFSLAGYILDHFTRPARRWENGRMLEFPPRHALEMFTFKGPVGTQMVAGLRAAATGCLARSFPEIPHIQLKAAFGTEMEEKCALLAGLGFNKREPINVDGQMVSPWAVLETLAYNQPPETKKGPDIRWGGCAIVRGLKDGQKREYRVEAWPSEGLQQKLRDMGTAKYGPGGVFRAGSPMGSVAVLMARGQIKERGVFFPELVVPDKEFFKQEVSAGMNIEVSKTVIFDA